MRCGSALLVLLVLGSSAHASSEDAFGISMFAGRYAVAPPAGGKLGFELAIDALGFYWGDDDVRHHAALLELDARDWGNPDDRRWSFLRYDLELRDPRWSVRLGLRAITLWAGDVRFGTPVLQLRAVAAPRLELTGEVDSAGLYLAAAGGRARSATRDVAVTATAAYPVDAAVRGELRLRVRDFELDAMHHTRDVTLTGGLGLALRTKNAGVRAMPGFLGIAVRRDPGTTIMLVAELAIGGLPK